MTGWWAAVTILAVDDRLWAEMTGFGWLWLACSSWLAGSGTGLTPHSLFELRWFAGKWRVFTNLRRLVIARLPAESAEAERPQRGTEYFYFFLI